MDTDESRPSRNKLSCSAGRPAAQWGVKLCQTRGATCPTLTKVFLIACLVKVGQPKSDSFNGWAFRKPGQPLAAN